MLLKAEHLAGVETDTLENAIAIQHTVIEYGDRSLARINQFSV
jgi:hypothetical protein